MDAAFLTAANPAAVKRSVMSSFKNVLLLPVTVVPRTAVNVGGAVFRTAGKGVSQLNPLNWQSSGAGTTSKAVSLQHTDDSRLSVDGNPTVHSEKGYIDFSRGNDGSDLVDSYDDSEKGYNALGDDDTQAARKGGHAMDQLPDDWSDEVKAWKRVAQKASEASARSQTGGIKPKMSRFDSAARLGVVKQGSATPPTNGSRSGTPALPPHALSSSQDPPTASSLKRMQLLLSLDTALQMIHFNRDCLKRIEAFSVFPGAAGIRVYEEVEEVAASFLHCLGEKHIVPGFSRATAQITAWQPQEQEIETTMANDSDQHVEPLVHFFELVHVGDTIAQMVQVYFEQELSRHIDATDFLNPVVRQRKRFESYLDEAVAAGLNAGVDLLMGQVEHIVTTSQDPRDFYPEAGAEIDLGHPTRACSLAIKCLTVHTQMLIGCADKTVLEVFWQEIGLRLHS